MDCFPSVFEYYLLQFYTYKQYTCTLVCNIACNCVLLTEYNLLIVSNSNSKIPQMLYNKNSENCGTCITCICVFVCKGDGVLLMLFVHVNTFMTKIET